MITPQRVLLIVGCVLTAASVSSSAAGPLRPQFHDCSNPGLIERFQEPSRVAAGSSASEPQVRIADVFVECDHTFTALFDSTEEAAEYASVLLATVAEIYRRDLAVELRIPDGYLRVWETIPPWYSEDVDPLSAMRDYWVSAENPLMDLERAAVLLLTDLSNGLGAAYSLAGLCNNDEAYAQSGLIGWFPLPLEHTSLDNQDPWVVAHEMGHVFGSFHTSDHGIEPNDGTGPDIFTIMGPWDTEAGMTGMRFHPIIQGIIRDQVLTFDCLEVVDIQPGDYNHNGVLDDSDLQAAYMCAGLQFVASGCVETFDLNGDGLVTFCEADMWQQTIHPNDPIRDCNSNGQMDGCEIVEGSVPDCNLNGSPDECDVDTASSPDCNKNNVPDECDIALVFVETSPELSPIGYNSPQTHMILAPPRALSEVYIVATARADLLSTTEYITLAINGNSLPFPDDRLFRTSGSFCPETPDTAQMVIDADLFNTWVNERDAEITLDAPFWVDPGACNPPSFIQIKVEYMAFGGSEDSNADGVPDECQLCPTDFDGDGAVGPFDLAQLLGNWGPCADPDNCPADLDGDGTVGAFDLVLLLGSWGPCP